MARNCEQHDQTHDDIRAEQLASAKEKLRRERRTEYLVKLRACETQRLALASPMSPVERGEKSAWAHGDRGSREHSNKR